MAWAAVDFFFHPDRRPPSYDTAAFPNHTLAPGWRVAANDTSLADYIWRRQADATAANGGGFLLALTQAPDTTAQLARLKRLLDAGQPVPLALPSLDAGAFTGLHVVAFDYQNDDVIIYDPNRPDITALLRVERDDKVVEHVAVNGTRAAGAVVATWKGFWIADGYVPESPPAGIEDILLHDISAPSFVDTTQTIEVSFQIMNVGEFDSVVHAVGLLVDDIPFDTTISVPHGRLGLSTTFTAPPFRLTLPPGRHEIAPVYYVGKTGPGRPLGGVRRIIVAQGFPRASRLELGALSTEPRVSPVRGRLLSGPSVFKPYAPFVYEVRAYKIALAISVEDDYGGGTFEGSIQDIFATLDVGTLRDETVKLTSPRTATYEAFFDPIPECESTVLRIFTTDAANAELAKALPVPCTPTETLPPIELERRAPEAVPDRARLGVRGIVAPLDPRIARRR